VILSDLNPLDLILYGGVLTGIERQECDKTVTRVVRSDSYAM